jgi:hypothetical protein
MPYQLLSEKGGRTSTACDAIVQWSPSSYDLGGRPASRASDEDEREHGSGDPVEHIANALAEVRGAAVAMIILGSVRAARSPSPMP